MHNFKGNYELFLKELEKFSDKNYSIEIVLHKESEIKNIKQVIDEKFTHKNNNIKYSTGTLRQGFFSPLEKIALFTEKDIFDRDILADTKKQTATSQTTKNAFNETLIDYKIGDIIVHSNYGIGKFLGFHKIKSKSCSLEKTQMQATTERTPAQKH